MVINERFWRYCRRVCVADGIWWLVGDISRDEFRSLAVFQLLELTILVDYQPIDSVNHIS